MAISTPITVNPNAITTVTSTGTTLSAAYDLTLISNASDHTQYLPLLSSVITGGVSGKIWEIRNSQAANTVTIQPLTTANTIGGSTSHVIRASSNLIIKADPDNNDWKIEHPTMLADEEVSTTLSAANLTAGAITPVKNSIKTVVALADAAATLTASQMSANRLFTITPTAGRALTTATAAEITAAMSGAIVGAWFEFTIVNLAAQVVTLTAGSGVTLVGVATINNVSGTWECRLDNVTASSEAVTIYRK